METHLSKARFPGVKGSSVEEQQQIKTENDYLADYNTEIVKNKALTLTKNYETIQDKIMAIFYIDLDRYFVRAPQNLSPFLLGQFYP